MTEKRCYEWKFPEGDESYHLILFESSKNEIRVVLTNDQRSDHFVLSYEEVIKLNAHSKTLDGYLKNALSPEGYPFQLVICCEDHKLILKVRPTRVTICEQTVDRDEENNEESRIVNKYFELSPEAFKELIPVVMEQVIDKIDDIFVEGSDSE